MKRLERYRSLYRSTQLYGAGKVLRRHIGVGDDFLLPMTVSHGVDFGHLSDPFEIENLEPIYWAYNAELSAAAGKIKPTVEIPHPFLLAAQGRKALLDKGPLIVGPPPGPENDVNVLEALRRAGVTVGTVLVKPRGPTAGSVAFWREHGFETASLGTFQSTNYDGMVETLGQYDPVISPTMSSVVIYSAALGADAMLLRDCEIRAYETADIAEVIAPAGDRARAFVRLFLGSDRIAKVSAARRLLGAELNDNPQRLLEDLERAVASVSEPIYFRVHYPAVLRAVLRLTALKSGRPGLILEPLGNLLKRAGGRQVSILTIKEISYWIEGRNPDNFRVEPAPFRPGKTEPGLAVVQYGG